MSRVFVAEETALGRRVVIKVLEPELAHGLSAERFAREAKLAARLQDPRIVPVLAAGTVGDLPYYTMPFVAGESLRARLVRASDSGQPVPLAESVSTGVPAMAVTAPRSIGVEVTRAMPCSGPTSACSASISSGISPMVTWPSA